MERRYSFFHGGPRRLLAVAAALVVASARADVDVSEYDPRASVSDRQSQQRYLRQIEIDKQAEAVREAERLLEEQRAEAERRRIEAARPWPERLTEQRCTLCHSAFNYTRNAHALPGWWTVALRMKLVNKAPVSWGELQIIVPHLAARHPAARIDHWVEWALALLFLASPALFLAIGYAAKRAYQRRRS